MNSKRPCYLLLLLVGCATAALPVIRIASDEPTDVAPSSSWMSENTNLTAVGVAAATDGCECACRDCHPVCTCSCSCPDPLHDRLAEERARLERRRLLERELQSEMSMGDCPGYVASFHLWNAQTNSYVREIRDGDVLCRPDYRLNIEARVESCDQMPIEGVQFDGSLGGRIENEFRYFVFGDFQGNILGKKLRPKSFWIKATPFSEDGAAGKEGKSASLHFSLIFCDLASQVLKLKAGHFTQSGGMRADQNS